MNILTELKQGISTGSPEEMRAVAGKFAAACPENITLALSGDLGAGKTVFVKGLAEAWGIAETVTSPSFTIFSVYEGQRNLIHLDAYRLNSPDEMEPLMIEEFLKHPYCLAVEWPEKIEEWLSEDSWKLVFSIDEEERHVVRLTEDRRTPHLTQD